MVALRIKFETHFVFVSINAFRFSQPSRFVLRDLRSNTEVLDNYMALMKKQGLKILDSMIPDLCRYDKELSSRTRTYFRCSLLPPPAGQLKGSGLQELANELIVKFNL